MLAESEEKLRKVQARAKDLEDKLQKLKDQLDEQQAYKAAANPWLIKSLVLLILLLVSVTMVSDRQRRSKNTRKKRHLLSVTCYLQQLSFYMLVHSLSHSLRDSSIIYAVHSLVKKGQDY